MSQEHPYLSSVPQDEQYKLRQSVFPAWHNRRRSDTSDRILNERERKRGSFDALMNFVEAQKLQQISDNTSFEQNKHTTTITKGKAPVSTSIHVHGIDEKDIEEARKNVRRNRSVKFTETDK